MKRSVYYSRWICECLCSPKRGQRNRNLFISHWTRAYRPPDLSILQVEPIQLDFSPRRGRSKARLLGASTGARIRQGVCADPVGRIRDAGVRRHLSISLAAKPSFCKAL